MTTRTFGFAYPLKYDDVKPGMLVSAQYGDRRLMALAIQGDREINLAVFDDDGDQEPRPPYILDMAEVHTTLSLIPGERHFEPAGATAFPPILDRRMARDGFFITSNGTIGLAVTYTDFGSRRVLMIDFDTGEPMKFGGSVAPLPPHRLFVTDDGTDRRREVVAKQPT